jgi:hypothetical protein
MSYWDYDPTLVLLLRSISEILCDHIITPPQVDYVLLRNKQRQLDNNLRPIEKNTRVIDSYVIVPPYHRCSDWDIYLYLNGVTSRSVNQVINRIKTQVGAAWVCLTDHAALWHCKDFNIDKTTSVKIGGFVDGVQHAPFFEITLYGLTPEVIKEVYNSAMHDLFTDWISVIVYRKYRKNNSISQVSRILKEALPESEAKRFDKTPINFIRDKLKSYDKDVYNKIITFLDISSNDSM